MIKKILISTEGYVECKSNFYTCVDILQSYMEFEFVPGVNKIVGEIDSGGFGISYLMSMYSIDIKENDFLTSPMVTVDGNCMKLSEFSPICCYLDRRYPLFSSKKTVRKLVEKGLKKSRISKTADEICEMFHMEAFRFDKPISSTGNERYKAMSAIGYAYGKEVFCFPWLSRLRFESFHNHMPQLFHTLSKLNKIVILPIGKDCFR